MQTSPISDSVAAEIRAALARQRYSANKLAADLGWSQSAMARRLGGKVAFTVAELVAVAEKLGIPASELLPPEHAGIGAA